MKDNGIMVKKHSKHKRNRARTAKPQESVTAKPDMESPGSRVTTQLENGNSSALGGAITAATGFYKSDSADEYQEIDKILNDKLRVEDDDDDDYKQ